MNVSRSFVYGAVFGAAVVIATMAVAGSGIDPVKQSPQYYTVRIDNDSVRVLEYRLKPGEKEPMHSHPPGFVYTLAPATLRTTLADGTVSDVESRTGDLKWRDATTHALENVGKSEAHVIAAELKTCQQR
jgi:hypothetical protein